MEIDYSAEIEALQRQRKAAVFEYLKNNHKTIARRADKGNASASRVMHWYQRYNINPSEDNLSLLDASIAFYCLNLYNEQTKGLQHRSGLWRKSKRFFSWRR